MAKRWAGESRWSPEPGPGMADALGKSVAGNLRMAILWLALIYVVGAYAFERVEGWNLVDSIYFITATITTVGYGDIIPRTGAGKMLAVLLMWTGISLAFYVIYTAAAYREQMIDREVRGRISKRLRVFRDLISLHGKGKGE